MFLLLPIGEKDSTIEISKATQVGRADDNDVVLEYSTVSSHHLIFTIENNELYVEDLNSTNGTYINDIKIESKNKYKLYDSDIIGIAEVLFKVKYNQKVKIEKKEYFSIGRNPESDLFINIPTVSYDHLKIVKENNEWIIIDNDSTNGTYLNSYSNRIKKTKLEKHQILYLGSYKLNTNDIFDLLESKGANTNENSVIVDKSETLIGRDPNADIFIDNVNVSWHHAKIIKEGDNYYIQDLDSTNGTFVNDTIIKEKTIINEGDTITVGVYSFIFRVDNNDNMTIFNLNNVGGFTIEAKNVSFKVNPNKKNEKVLLDDISFTVYPGELVGIMGLSGAGKTTLLKTLSGYTKPTEGNVYINGLDLYKNFDRIKNSIGYVPQEDIMHPELTVYEALLYSFKLRLKENISIDEINKRIDNILLELGIPLDKKDVQIGSPDKKGLSGGQKKRVNIAMELLADPEIIFLDEPTSGLSSVDAKIVMEKLRELSDKGKTVILTIHQPSLTNYKKMDNIIILTEGKLAYFGHNYPDSIEFFNEDKTSDDVIKDPDMALLGLYEGETKNNINWKEKFKNSNIYKRFILERSNKNNSKATFEENTTPSAFKQFITLTSRYFNLKIKDKINSAILLLQAPIIGFLLVFLFSGESGVNFNNEHPNVLLFILVLSSLWFGMINSVKEIVSEKAIYERERLIGLKLLPYISSKFIVLSILSLIQVLILIGIVYLFIPMKLNILNLTFLIFITSITGVSIGLLTSAIAKSVSQALSLIPIILLPMIIFGGGMLPIKNLSTGAYGVSFLMPTRWALEEAVRIYDRGLDPLNTPLREPIDANGTRKYLNSEVKEIINKNGIERNDDEDTIECQDRRCVEALYITADPDERDKWIFRTTDTKVIYLILFLFIIIPLGLVLLILNKRFKR